MNDLNVEKIKEIVVDFRRQLVQHPRLTINAAAIERVSSLGSISRDMSLNINITYLPKKAQQWLYFLWKLRRAQTPIMHSFYRSTIERESCPAALPLWYGSCIISCRKTLQGTVRAAEKIIGVSFPTLVDMYHTRFTHNAAKNCT